VGNRGQGDEQALQSNREKEIARQILKFYKGGWKASQRLCI